MMAGRRVSRPFQLARWLPFCRRLPGLLSITVLVQTEDFDFVEHYSQIRASGGEAVGAIAGFVGLVRDYNAHAGDGGEVTLTTLEHYPGMTESSIEACRLGRAGRCWRQPWSTASVRCALWIK